jgi:hypothetical protein
MLPNVVTVLAAFRTDRLAEKRKITLETRSTILNLTMLAVIHEGRDTGLMIAVSDRARFKSFTKNGDAIVTSYDPSKTRDLEILRSRVFIEAMKGKRRGK